MVKVNEWHFIVQWKAVVPIYVWVQSYLHLSMSFYNFIKPLGAGFYNVVTSEFILIYFAQ
jgi:hypothetical protein